ncbi:MAG: hypothetical protein ACR2QC_09285 [Gammaproteobacteria bacterium]
MSRISIPAKAGISAAAKRRAIVRLCAFGAEIPAFAGMAFFYIFGYR